MNTHLRLPPRPAAMQFIAATLAGAIAIAIVAGMASLFLRDGTPMQQLVAAERACAGHAYVSEREVCARDWVVASGAPRIASQQRSLYREDGAGLSSAEPLGERVSPTAQYVKNM